MSIGDSTGGIDDYRYKRFTTNLLFRDLRFGREAAASGDGFPPFELITTSGERSNRSRKAA